MHKLERLARCVSPPIDHVLDIGANCGVFSKMVLDFGAADNVIAFEPSPSLAGVLRLNCGDSVNIEPIAISQSDGEASFFRNPKSEQTNSLQRSSVQVFAKEIDEITVPTKSIDSYVESKAISGNIVMKIDVQGAEMDVISGASRTLSSVETVIIEASWLDINSVRAALKLAELFPYCYVVNSVLHGSDLAFTRSPITAEIKDLYLFQA
ncbi:FkbM family methyltransferase [Roseiconus lacunae]|uniref:FkbM family methyltransferase n=1 Tax=Roseiconus lacunae TaxID=2605694 RepID=UPI001E5ABF71|nr:FkbM family methyltransferase [Roseiconus lacunae]MCD0458880.1 FkbM family methyltransferase [Roseiconus lacunae]